MVHGYDSLDIFKICLRIGCEIPARFCILPVNLETAAAVEELYYSGPVCLAIRSDWLRHGLSESPLESHKRSFPYRFQRDVAGEDVIAARVFVNSPWLMEKPTDAARMVETVLGRTLVGGIPVQFVVRDDQSGTANWLVDPNSSRGDVDVVVRRLKRMARGFGSRTLRYGD